MKKNYNWRGWHLSNGVVRDLRWAVRCHGSQIEVARLAKVSPQFVSDVINGRREPSGKILEFLGYEREVFYRRKNP